MSDGNLKVPSQVFRWFEKMKTNYESSVQSVLARFEDYNAKQQGRLDKANDQHIDNLKSAHQAQINQSQAQIEQLTKDIEYYKQQIAKQQQTIEQLNTRYDAVMTCLLTEKNKDINVKDIFDNDDFFTVADKTELLTPSHAEEEQEPAELQKEEEIALHSTEQLNGREPSLSESLSDDERFDLAVKHREEQEYELAYQLFKQAANNEHLRSMGAMGRSHFLGEGTEENHALGLAWLIKAAESELPQAISRVAHFQEQEPELYQQARELLETSPL